MLPRARRAIWLVARRGRFHERRDGVGARGEKCDRAEARIGGGDERPGLRAGAPAEIAEAFRVDRRAGCEYVGRTSDGDDVADGRLGRPGEQLGDVRRGRQRVGGGRRGDRHRDGPALSQLDRLREKLRAIAARPVNEDDAGLTAGRRDRLDQIGLDRLRAASVLDVVDDDRALALDHAAVDEGEDRRGIVGERELRALAGGGCDGGSRRGRGGGRRGGRLRVRRLRAAPAACDGEERKRTEDQARARPGSPVRGHVTA